MAWTKRRGVDALRWDPWHGHRAAESIDVASAFQRAAIRPLTASNLGF